MTPRRYLGSLLSSAEFAQAYTLTALAAVFASFAIGRLTSTVTQVTIIALLSVVGALVLWVRRAELTLLRFAPSSLLAFITLAALSTLWSTDRADTFSAWISLLGHAVIAITIGHTRDTLQTVRAIGDTLRMLLVLSLGVELLAGVMLDMPFPFLGIQGHLADGGPIQGIFGTRNMLGFVAVIALITFVIEWRSRSVTAGLGVASISLAGMLALLSASPSVVVLAAGVGVATGALSIVRHTSPARRAPVQWVLGGLVITGLLTAFALRHQIIRLLDAGSDFSTRADLWNQLLEFTSERPILGWGWFGRWPTDEFPFVYVNILLDDTHRSALNAYFVVLLQLGGAGLVLFLALGGVALVRSWLVASVRRSVVYAWIPLVVVALGVESMFESFTLTGAGWVLLVLCALRAGQNRSWREDIDAAHTESMQTLPPRE